MTQQTVVNKLDSIEQYSELTKRILTDIIHFYNDETTKLEGFISVVKIDENLIDLYCETCSSFDCIHTKRAWNSSKVMFLLNVYKKYGYELAYKCVVKNEY